MLLSYSTGSYVGYSLANKVSTTGDASISGDLDVGQDQAQTSIKTYDKNHVVYECISGYVVSYPYCNQDT